jgi:glycosyltransferase involved in cell wall biosynthesis
MEGDSRARAEVAELESQLLALAVSVVIVSELMRTQIERDAALIPNGVDFAAFAPAGHRRDDGHPLRIVYAGTLDPFRLDYKLLVDLASQPGIEVVLIGPGQPPSGLSSMGVVPRQELPGLLANCDALIAPYRIDQAANRTSDALKLYEYFATGLPVIATPIAGFERYPDLVISWPAKDIIGACHQQALRASDRQTIAQAADWSHRAIQMRGVLARAAAQGRHEG